MVADRTYIHEFSLRLDVEVGNSGRWQYRSGMKLNYQRSTLKVSHSVEQAILKKAFLVEFPLDATAFVSKVIFDSQVDGIHWSVAAVITYRSASETEGAALYYRFFLCQGTEKLSAIVDYLETYYVENSRWPSYEHESQSRPTISQHQAKSAYTLALTPALDQKIRYQCAPLFLSLQECNSLSHLHAISTAKSKLNGKPIAWACNVEKPSYIEQFQAILFSDEQTLQAFKQIAIPGLSDETYSLLLPRLWQDLETFVAKEIKQQLHLGGQTDTFYPGTPVSGAYQRTLALNMSGLPRQEVLELYNEAPDTLKVSANSASLSKRSIRMIAENSDRKTNLVLETRSNGRYWIVFDLSEDSNLEDAWLVPSPNFRITPYDYENIISRLFDCGDYIAELSGFYLIKPAKVKLLPDRRSWQFVEAGELSLITPQKETKMNNK